MSTAAEAVLSLDEEPGWTGSFTRHQAEGALANGTRIKKFLHEEGDGTPLGTLGKILGSIFVPEVAPVPFYFVEWDNRPKVAVGVMAWKIASVDA